MPVGIHKGVCWKPILLSVLLACTSMASAQTADSDSTADHSRFESLKGPFDSASDVTRACLTCHTEAASQVQQSIHWTWEYDHPVTGQTLGKQHVINAFCGNVASNEARCTSCHAGYGWEDTQTFDFSEQTAVDCLACHDTTGEYTKWNDKAGHPLYEPVTQAGRAEPYPDVLIVEEADGSFTHMPPDLASIAGNVGAPDRANCGNCHFYGGGGDNVKHGDLSSALIAPSPHTDVHMSPEGADLACSDCHVSHGHLWAGSRYYGTIKDDNVQLPGFRNTDTLSCDSCHGNSPHGLSVTGLKLDQHTDTVACQTCHIPEFAKGGKATKVWWDWSTAGKLRDGKPYVEHDEKGRHTYLSTKGDFRWEEDVVPEYRFWNGVVEYTLPGEKIDPTQIVGINRIHGSVNDPESRIYPFKHMLGRQAYDADYENLVFSQVYGPDTDTAFWTNFSWDKALKAGMAKSDVAYSGHYGFVDTEMWWPTTHMVSPAAEALECDSCHARDGRLAALDGFYLPGRDRFTTTDRIGLLLLALSLAAIALHASIRLLMKRRTRA